MTNDAKKCRITENHDIEMVCRSRIARRNGEGGRGAKILESTFFFARASRKRKHAKFRENPPASVRCVPHFDPRRVHHAATRDATRRDAMCSIIRIDDAEGGVDGGGSGRRGGDWSRARSHW